jgi:hypothetical protein
MEAAPSVLIEGQPAVVSAAVGAEKATVFIGGKPVVTVPPSAAPSEDGNAVSASEAISQLRSLVDRDDPTDLFELETRDEALREDGTSTGWTARFLTNQPGKTVLAKRFPGGVNMTGEGTVPTDAKGITESDASLDSKRLYAIGAEAAVENKVALSKITATLKRDGAKGRAVWILQVYSEASDSPMTLTLDAQTLQPIR